MPQIVRHYLWLVPVGLCIFFANLGAAGLFDEDEPKNAACAYEMLVRGDWVVPSFNHELRPEKPVLLYWLMILAYQAFGVTEFAARFWSAALALGTVLTTYHLGRRLFSAEAAFWAALALSTAVMFDVVARAATPDSTLIFFATLGMYAFVRSVGSPTGCMWQDAGCRVPADAPDATKLAAFAPRRSAWWVLAGVSFGLAVLAKGPVGIVLPLGILVAFAMLVTAPPPGIRAAVPADWFERLTVWLVRLCEVAALRRLRSVVWSVRPLLLLGVVAAVTLPWYVAVGMQTEGRWLAGFLGQHNLGRFLSPMENHSGPFFYYIVAILAGFFPWSIFLLPTLLDAGRRMRAAHRWAPGYLLLFCWAGTYVLFFTLARTKLPNYVLPAYPALALLTGAFIEHWIHEPQVVGLRWVRWAIASLGIVGVGLLVGLSVAGGILLQGEVALGLLGLVPIAGAAAAFWAVRRERTRWAAVSLSVTAVLLVSLLFGVVAVRVSRYQSSPQLVAQTRAIGSPSARIAVYDYFQPSLVFYARRRIERLSYTEVQRYFDDPSERYLLVFEDQLDQLWPELPPGVDVLSRQPRFLRDERIALIGRTPSLATANTRADSRR